MSLTAVRVTPEGALDALALAIREAKDGDLLAPVTVVVPTNGCGVMARRALGREGGVVGVDMVTLDRLVELIAGPRFAAAGRSPVSAAITDIAVHRVLADRPGMYGTVADHPSTISALSRLHDEIRLVGDESAAALAASSRRGSEATRVSAAVRDSLSADWYDRADLLIGATAAVVEAAPLGLSQVILHLPFDLAERQSAFVRALAGRIPVQVLVEVVGQASADADADALLERLGIEVPSPLGSEAPPASEPVGPPPRVVSTTDADDEVRIAVRAVVDAARAGTGLGRIAVLWPASEPYARLVEHHLDAAEIRWNGPGGTTLRERLVCRLLLDLLDLDQRGLRRRGLFALLADVPARDDTGQYLPSASWERVSREAGVARDADWDPRLAAYADHDRWGESAAELSVFVDGLRGALGDRRATRRWWDWADWCVRQLDRWIGRQTLERLPEREYAAWESLTAVLDRLRHLDRVGDPVTRHRFRAALAAELDAVATRHGRIGDGVTIGSLDGAIGLDIDVAVVLGAAEGSLPPAPRSDALISEVDRAAAGLAGSDARSIRMHRRMLAILSASEAIVTVPRGDLRATATREPSRWIAALSDAGATEVVASHMAGLAGASFAASESEHRLSMRYGHVLEGGDVSSAPGADGDVVLQRAVRLVAARRSNALTEYDGNLSSTTMPRLDRAVSPTRLERWAKCPHAYFMRDLLGLYPIDEPDDDITITALERGGLHHGALDLFHRAVVAGDLPQPTAEGWGDVHREALLRFLAEVCDRSERRGRTGRPASWADERARMQDDLLHWLEHDGAHAAERGARVIASEHGFDAGDEVHLELADGRALALVGSVDRIDRGRDGKLYVTDHKTGRDTYKELDENDPTLGGTAFQLPSYAAAARAFTGEPDAPVRAEYGLMGKGRYARRGYVLDEQVWERVVDDVSSVVSGIESGYYPNRPARPGFRMYTDCQYCEPDHLGTDARWDAWHRKRHDAALAPWFAPDETGAVESNGADG